MRIKPEYLNMMRDKFGQKSVDGINELFSIPLKRRILEKGNTYES